jgi:hypothetical protein
VAVRASSCEQPGSARLSAMPPPRPNASSVAHSFADAFDLEYDASMGIAPSSCVSSSASSPLADAAADAAASSSFILAASAAAAACVSTSTWRVEGSLNLSRSLGDGHLKQFISSTPSVLRHDLLVDDNFVILATDGVWNVMTDQQAVTVVGEFLRAECEHPVTHRQGLAARAAEHLAQLAMKRGSKDNVLTCVIDLRRYTGAAKP